MALSQRELMRLEVRAEVTQALAGLGAVQGAVAKTGAAVHRGSFAALGMSLAYGQASRVLLGFGAAVVGVAAVTGKLAIDFSKDMALVRTQTDITDKAFATLGKNVIQISNETSKSTHELAEGLYDIFSGIDVTAAEATNMLRLMAKAAVAGNTDIRTVARATIGMFNAFNLTAADTNRILDAQFQFVRLGVGTYEEFATQLGSLSGSATAFGQTLETMVAALAVATKGSLSTSEAVTATARAMDLLAKPANITALEQYGIVMKDAQGEFLQMDQIVQQLADKFEGMTRPEIKEQLAELFGEGEIRAMRFFNLAIPRVDILNDAVQRLTGPNAMGAMNKAFETMRDSAAFSVEKAVNVIKNMGTVIGQSFLPSIKDALGFLTGLVKAIAGMDPETRKTIASILLFTGVLSLLAGIFLRIVSNIYNFISAIKLAGVSMIQMGRNIFGVIGIMSLLMGVLGEVMGVDGLGGISIVVGIVALTVAKHMNAIKGMLETVALKAMYLADAFKAGGLGGAIASLATPTAIITLALIALVAAILAVASANQKLKDTAVQAGIEIANGTTTLREYQSTLEQTIFYQDSWQNSLLEGSGILGLIVDKSELLNIALGTATGELIEQSESIERSRPVVGRYGQEVVDAAIAEQEFAKATKLSEAAQEAHQNALSSTADVFSELAQKARLSFEQIQKAVEKQGNIIRDYTRNFDQLIAMGLPPEFLKMLHDLGLEGMAIVEQLAGQSEREVRRLAREWMRQVEAMESREIDITVDANTDPAKRAIDGLRAYAAGVEARIAIGIGGWDDPGGTIPTGGDNKERARATREQAQAQKDLAYSTNLYADAAEDSAAASSSAAESTDTLTKAQERQQRQQEKNIAKFEEMQDQLKSVREALRAFEEAGAHMDKYTEKVVRAQIKTKDFEGAVDTLEQALENHNTAVDIATEALTNLEREASEVGGVLGDALSNSAKIAGMEMGYLYDAVTNTYTSLANEVHPTIDQIIAAQKILTDQIKGYAVNWQILLQRGMPLSMLDQLKSMGLEGANVLAALASANDEQFNEIVSLWSEGEQTLTDVWAEIEESANDSTEAIMASQEALAQTLEKFAADWEKIINRGMPKALAKQLKEMGLEGKDVVAALANANDEQFAKIIKKWSETIAPLENTFNKIDSIKKKIDDLPDEKTSKIKADIEKAETELAKWIQKIKDTDVGIEVATVGTGGVGNKPGKAHGGGPLHGTTREFPILAEDGEFMFRKEAVWELGERNLSMWNQQPRKLREQLAKYHSGGLVKYHQGGALEAEGTPHGHMTYNFAGVTNAVNMLIQELRSFRVFSGPASQIPGTSSAGLNSAAMYALRATYGTFPWTYLLSGLRPGAIVRGTNTPSQHGIGNAIDISAGDWSRLWEVFDWAYENRSKIRLDYMVLSAAGRNPLQYSGGSFSTPSAINTADHRNHVHMDFYGDGGVLREPVIGVGVRSKRGYMFGEKGPEKVTPLGQGEGKHVEMHFHNANVNPKDVVQELAWYDRTSGR